MKKTLSVCLLLVLLSVPVQALPLAEDSSSWWEVTWSLVLDWFGLSAGEAVLHKSSTCTTTGCPEPPPPSSTTSDGDNGCAVDPNGCPKPKP
jgi:hypothetical protein